jgi:endonuclease YncB( thermonuclease family)
MSGSIILGIALQMLPIFSDISASGIIEGQAEVLDGSTLQINERQVYLFGVEAPAIGTSCDLGDGQQDCGTTALMQLERLIGDATVECLPKYETDASSVVAICSVSGRDIGRTMVDMGWARARAREASDYLDAEGIASARRQGLWAEQRFIPIHDTHRSAIALRQH